MSAFVNQLRARAEPLRLVAEGGSSITVRVQMAEVWDVIKVVASPEEPVRGLKVRALEVLYPRGDFHEEFVLKLKGWEVLDENVSLAAAGAVDGSTFLLQHRFRRPVR